MKIKINKSEILKNIGIELPNEEDYLLYIWNLLDWFEYHSKNLTKEQYFKINEIKEILNNIKIEKY